MVIPFLVIYLFNWIIFGVIFMSLVRKYLSSSTKETRSKDKKNQKSFLKQQLLVAITLSVLFGLGWGIGLLATNDIYTNKTIRDLFASLFVLITSFHGLFIFIMHCLRSKDVRSIWKKWLFGITRKDFSEFTSSFVRHKRGPGKFNAANNSFSSSLSFKKTNITTLRRLSNEEKKEEFKSFDSHMEIVIEPSSFISEAAVTKFIESSPDYKEEEKDDKNKLPEEEKQHDEKYSLDDKECIDNKECSSDKGNTINEQKKD